MLSSRPLWPSQMFIVPHDLHPPTWRQGAPDTDPATREWLLDTGSLTRRLTALAAGRFSVQPLHEGWQTLRDDECAALQLPLASTGWVREVYLLGADTPWVFARSVAGRSALAAHALNLDTLGSRSLGELLFSDPAFTRQPLQTCRYPGSWLPAAHNRDSLWARRSRFDRQGLGVLVAEVFLPALWHAALPLQETR